ncbi:MAG: malto-oligosyltrehalose synthase, partial [Desulfobacterales bacterium]
HPWEAVPENLDPGHPDRVKLSSVLEILAGLPVPEKRAERYHSIGIIKDTLRDLYAHNPAIQRHLDASVHLHNGQKGRPASFQLLDQLLAQQVFSLAYWKVAGEEINYRRFFDINELITLRQENREVFEKTHLLIGQLMQRDWAAGVRIDHVDGLADPAEYLRWLRQRVGDKYLVVEKILEAGETLPRSWPVQGTTGYDFGDLVNGIFCRRRNRAKSTATYVRFSRQDHSWAQIVYASKRRVLETQLAGDLDNLARTVKSLAAREPCGRDCTRRRLKDALKEVLACLPVYRTYIAPGKVTPTDRRRLQAAVESSVGHRSHLQSELSFIQRLLLGECGPERGDDEAAASELQKQAITGFQQLSAPVMAKGFEDTALYVYNRLISLNEVGGNPERFGWCRAEFHDFNRKRERLWPHAMNCTATHDSKRGEDVRARINVLSEVPEEWAQNIEHWHALNRKKKTRRNGGAVPDKNEEYFLYQTLLGAFPSHASVAPDFVARIRAYVRKAAREAKVHTSWQAPDEEYEAALMAFAEKILDPSGPNPFLEAFVPFGRKVAFYGIFNSLAQTLIKITAPGVPDFYQGTELPDLNLVDPDNRRSVDFAQRRRLLAEIRSRYVSDPLALLAELRDDLASGRIKLFVVATALQMRNEQAALFRHGRYLPLNVAGRFRDHVIAYARVLENQWSITVVPRFLTDLVQPPTHPLGKRIWRDTAVELPADAPSRWHNILTSETLDAAQTIGVGQALQHFPVASLLGEKKL